MEKEEAIELLKAAIKKIEESDKPSVEWRLKKVLHEYIKFDFKGKRERDSDPSPSYAMNGECFYIVNK